jgi:hypothetical protein
MKSDSPLMCVSPIYVFGFEIPFKIANSSIIHNMFSSVVRYDPS